MFESIYSSLSENNNTSLNEEFDLESELDLLLEIPNKDNFYLTYNEVLNFTGFQNEEILSEGIKDIFKNIKSATVDLTKIPKAKKMIEKEYNINIDKYINKYKTNLNDIAKLANTSNISNDKDAENLEQNITKQFTEFLPKLIKDITDDLAKNLEIIYDTYYTETSSNTYNKFLKSCLCLIIPSTINSVFLVIFTLIFNDKIMGMKITSAIVTPLTEELVKLTSEKFVGSTKHGISAYNITFNIFEFSDYIIKIYSSLLKSEIPNESKGDYLKASIAIRIPAVIMHTVNTGLIKLGIKKNPELGGEKAVCITILIHAFFNSFGAPIITKTISNNILFNEENKILDEGLFSKKEKPQYVYKTKNPSACKNALYKCADYFMKYADKLFNRKNTLKISEDALKLLPKVLYIQFSFYPEVNDYLKLRDESKNFMPPNTLAFEGKEQGLNSWLVLVDKFLIKVHNTKYGFEFEWVFDASWDNEFSYTFNEVVNMTKLDMVSPNIMRFSKNFISGIGLKDKKSNSNAFETKCKSIFKAKNISIKIGFYGASISFGENLSEDIILDEGFIFGRNKNSKKKIEPSNRTNTLKILNEVANMYHKIFLKSSYFKDDDISIHDEEDHVILSLKAVNKDKQLIAILDSCRKIGTLIRDYEDYEGHDRKYIILYKNNLIEISNYWFKNYITFEWLFDNTVTGVPYDLNQIVKILKLPYIGGPYFVIGLYDNYINVSLTASKYEQFKNDCQKIFKNSSYNIEVVRDKIYFK